MMLAAEGMHLRTGDPVWRALARRWSKVFAVLFAVGAASGTIISFELGLLFPRFMAYAGGIIGLPFSLEGAAFFIEAIFVGIYLYGWNRLSPRAHWLSGIPIAISAVASAFFIVTANAWMNVPRGFQIVHGRVTHVDPLAAMFNPAWATETSHMVLGAYLATAFGVASVYAIGMLRGRRDAYHRKAIALALSTAAILAPLQLAAGDLLGRTVAAPSAGHARRDRGRRPHRARRGAEHRRVPAARPQRRRAERQGAASAQPAGVRRSQRARARSGHLPQGRPHPARTAPCGSPSSAWSGSAPGSSRWASGTGCAAARRHPGPRTA